MPNPRTWTDEQLQEAILQNTTISGVLRDLGLSTSPGNFRSFHRHIERLGLDTSHFKGRSHGTSRSSKTRSLHELLVKDGPHIGSSGLKKRLLKAGVLEETCSGKGCGVKSDWLGKPISLHLDHINGEYRDNRLENLRILCPNCHSQTPTFTGKNLKSSRYRRKMPPPTCMDCGETTSGHRWERCPPCAATAAARPKIVWPPDEALIEMVRGRRVEATGRKLGVSGTAIKKRLKKRGLWPLPPSPPSGGTP